MNTITIRAKAIESTDSEGTGYPSAVRIDGGSFLNFSAAQDIAQEAVGALYGDYESGYLAVVNPSDWREYQLSVANHFIAKVIKV